MAIAHHDFDESAATGTQGDITWSYTPPAGTLKGAVVLVVQEGAGDTVVGVTYGASSMTRVRSDELAAGEPGRVYVYFLGSSVPSGTQTITVDTDGTLLDRHALVATLTADASALEVDVSNGDAPGIVANPSLTLDYADGLADWVGYYVLYSGAAAPVTTVEAGSTHMDNVDLGAACGMYALKEGAGGNSTTIGYTLAADDVCHAGLIIREAGPATVNLTPAALPLAAVALDPDPGPVTTALTPATLTLAAQAIDPDPQPIAVALTPAVMTLAAVALGPVVLTPATLTLAAVAHGAVPGPVAVNLTPAQITLIAVALSISAAPYPLGRRPRRLLVT